MGKTLQLFELRGVGGWEGGVQRCKGCSLDGSEQNKLCHSISNPITTVHLTVNKSCSENSTHHKQSFSTPDKSFDNF